MALDIAKHHDVFISILKDIYGDAGIASLLGFKGGTAAYLFYGLPRFSVDLDFDLLDETKEDFVFEKVEQILRNYGKIKESEKKRFNLLFLLSYEDKARNLKVEINRRAFGSRYEIASYMGISMLVMVREDMAAHKLNAMAERIGKATRDVFDVWFFLKNSWPVNKEIVEKRANTPFKNFLNKCVGLLEDMPDRDILSGLGELLTPKQKAWAKANLKKDAIFWLKVRLQQEK